MELRAFVKHFEGDLTGGHPDKIEVVINFIGELLRRFGKRIRPPAHLEQEPLGSCVSGSSMKWQHAEKQEGGEQNGFIRFHNPVILAMLT
jgi:hypothetical protein